MTGRRSAGRLVVALAVPSLVAVAALWLARTAWSRSPDALADIGVVRLVGFFAGLVLVHALTLVLWRRFSALHGSERAVADAFVDLGVSAIGKYLPGKVAGLLGRGAYTDGKLRPSVGKAALSVSEQLICLWGGLALLCAFALASRESGAIAVLVLCATAPTIAVLPFALCARSHRLRGSRLFGPVLSMALHANLLLVFGYLVLWTLNALPFIALVTVIPSLGTPELIHVGMAFVAAVIVGWLAFVVPAGIGVREAAFVALAPSSLGWEQATSLIALHRGLSTTFDVALGAAVLATIASRHATRLPA